MNGKRKTHKKKKERTLHNILKFAVWLRTEKVLLPSRVTAENTVVDQ